MWRTAQTLAGTRTLDMIYKSLTHGADGKALKFEETKTNLFPAMDED